jgi:hypothetical protein
LLVCRSEKKIAASIIVELSPSAALALIAKLNIVEGTAATSITINNREAVKRLIEKFLIRVYFLSV